jgi:hypothetical protein
MIHPGRESQMRDVEAVEPTFDFLDSAHDCFQLLLKTQHLRLNGLAHALPLSQAKAKRADLNMSATEVRYGSHDHVDP